MNYFAPHKFNPICASVIRVIRHLIAIIKERNTSYSTAFATGDKQINVSEIYGPPPPTKWGKQRERQPKSQAKTTCSMNSAGKERKKSEKPFNKLRPTHVQSP